MKRSTPLRRKTALPKFNAKRKRVRFRKQFGSADRVERIKQMECLARSHPYVSCWGPIECAHVVSRGAGGDYKSIVPLCTLHHKNQHAMGIRSFEETIGRDLTAEAERIAREIDDAHE